MNYGYLSGYNDKNFYVLTESNKHFFNISLETKLDIWIFESSHKTTERSSNSQVFSGVDLKLANAIWRS